MDRKVVLVTGAAKGIGKAIAYRMLQDGFITVFSDTDQQAGEKCAADTRNENAVFMPCDVSEETQVSTLFANLTKRYGRLDVLVNNAGIIRDNLIWNMPLADFDKIIAVNLRGTWLMCREAAGIMREQNRGRIINIASRAWLGNAGQTNYSASKAGVIGLTRALALELGKHKVLVNAVAPGLIDTTLTQSLSTEVREKLIRAQPTHQMGTPEDVANAVAFLASEQNGFINGQTLYVDGGKSIGAGV